MIASWPPQAVWTVYPSSLKSIDKDHALSALSSTTRMDWGATSGIEITTIGFAAYALQRTADVMVPRPREQAALCPTAHLASGCRNSAMPARRCNALSSGDGIQRTLLDHPLPIRLPAFLGKASHGCASGATRSEQGISDPIRLASSVATTLPVRKRDAAHEPGGRELESNS